MGRDMKKNLSVGLYLVFLLFGLLMQAAEARPFRLCLEQSQKCGIADTKSAQWVIPPVYDGVSLPDEQGYIQFMQGDKYGFINTKNQLIYPAQNRPLNPFSRNGLLLVTVTVGEKDDEKYIFVDRNFQQAFPESFVFAYDFDENGLARVLNAENQWGVINSSGTLVIPYQFRNLGEFAANGLATFTDGPNYGFIDKKGRIVIEPRFSYAESFSENGLAKVTVELENKETKDFYINEKGELQDFSKQFDRIFSFAPNGLALVVKKGRFGFINSKGEEVIPCIYEKILEAGFTFGPLVSFEQGGKVAVLNDQGQIIFDLKTNYVVSSFEQNIIPINTFDTNGLAAVSTMDKEDLSLILVGFTDKTGHLIVRFTEPYYFSSSIAGPEFNLGNSVYRFYSQTGEEVIFDAKNRKFIPTKFILKNE